MAHQTASDRAGIPGVNQSLDDYGRVLEVRRIAFAQWMKQEYPDLTHMNECDWDEQYQAWVELDSML